MLSNGGAAEEGPEEEEQVDEALIDKGEGIIGEEMADIDKAEDDVAGYHEESRAARSSCKQSTDSSRGSET